MTLRLRSSLALALLLAIAVLPSHATSGQRGSRAQRLASETYAAVKVDVEGRLVITTSDSRTVVVPKEKEQTEFSVPVISSSRTAVGALAMFGNCCTSYDIPLQLVIYRSGRAHRFTGINLPIWLWHFTDADRRVAFGQSEVHSACRTHYELRDIESQRLIESVDVPRACGPIPNPPVITVPKWVAELESAWAARPLTSLGTGPPDAIVRSVKAKVQRGRTLLLYVPISAVQSQYPRIWVGDVEAFLTLYQW